MIGHHPLLLAVPVCLFAWPVLANAPAAWLLAGVPAAAFAVCLCSAYIGSELLPRFELTHLQVLVFVLVACGAASLLATRLRSDMQSGWLLVVGCSIALLDPGARVASAPSASTDALRALLWNAAVLTLLLLVCRAAARQRKDASLSARLIYGAVLALLLIGSGRWLAPAPDWQALHGDAIGAHSNG